MRTIGSSDISDDEESPSYAAINGPADLGDAMRARNFTMALHQGASSAVLSTNVDTVANALGREVAYPTSSNRSTSSGENSETSSQIRRRYMKSNQEEVSDPDSMGLSALRRWTG